ncbi:dihydrolipoyl dehydrogenase [Buchnera aphidicola]|uniref:Dihydrolipoyl dehydrogenase n=1 Tax=Buchnera aphidicola subsp. Cinara cedri (strain Cc) TaxID=372461 RepID=Q057U0_BUCCC|nr:dihydrolipoyl dehydrogenase [Buchnera aphidicola]ABJ90609.1 pyruvate and 2-oxoglutarate dehydrogenase E3 component (dihydrolipoamide dehydrogenase) [Buchnera aphidicola BCc]
MNKNINVNVVVIGGGPAGYSAAFRCSDLGFSTLIIEKYGILGGTCLNVGCIPSKSFLYLATLIKEIKEFSKYGIDLCANNKIDISKIMKWKDNIVLELSNGLKNMAEYRKIDILKGVAKFFKKNQLKVILNNGKISYIKYDYAIIATGSKPITLSNFFSKDSRIWNSTHALNSDFIPKKLLIIGAGIIGLEMATIYSTLGSEVDIIDNSEKFFPLIDKDVSDVFLKYIQKYFSISLNTSILSSISDKDGILVNTKINHNTYNSKMYHAILIAVGRTANTDCLDINIPGIKVDKYGFIQVDNQMRTNISNIFAIGDVVGQPMLAHKGMHEAHIAAEVIAGKKHFFDPKVIPCVAYCDPEIAWTGIMEEEAKNKGINCRSIIFPWKFLGKAISSNCSIPGLTKLIVDTNSNRIIGGVIIGKHAGELLSQINLSIEMGCDIEDIALTIHPHPSLSESINISAQLFNGTATDMINKNII